MIHSKSPFPALLLAGTVLAGSVTEAQPFSDELVDQSWQWNRPPLNDESFYKQIQGVELRSHSTFLRHPYEVVIPNTVFGTFFFCQLFDEYGELVTSRYENAGQGETNIFFTIKVPITSAVCVDVRDYRNVD